MNDLESLTIERNALDYFKISRILGEVPLPVFNYVTSLYIIPAYKTNAIISNPEKNLFMKTTYYDIPEDIMVPLPKRMSLDVWYEKNYGK